MLTACCQESPAQPPGAWAARLSVSCACSALALAGPTGGARGQAVALHQALSLESTLKGKLFKYQKSFNAMMTGLYPFELECKIDRGH